MKKKANFKKIRKNIEKLEGLILMFLGFMFLGLRLGFPVQIILLACNFILYFIENKESKKIVLTEEEERSTAYHEAGHVVLFRIMNWQINEASILPTQDSIGHVSANEKEKKTFYSKEEMEDKIMIYLAGRVAESLVLNKIDEGACNDLKYVTSIAIKMITEYGMDDEIGPVSINKDDEASILYINKEMNKKIWQKVFECIKELEKRTRRILVSNREFLEVIAQALLKHKTLTGEEIEKYYQKLLNENVDNTYNA